jgi:hypothetical protein
MLESARREQPTLASRIGIRELLIARGDLDTARALVEEQAQLLIGYMGPDVTGRVLNLPDEAGRCRTRRGC